jgi:branched-subunit amino acid transport protein
LHRKITSDAIKRLLFFVFDNKAMFGYFFFFFLDNKAVMIFSAIESDIG